MAKKPAKKPGTSRTRDKNTKKDDKKPSKGAGAKGSRKTDPKRDLETAVSTLLSRHASPAHLTVEHISLELSKKLEKPIARNKLLDAIDSVVSKGKLASRYSFALVPAATAKKASKAPQEGPPSLRRGFAPQGKGFTEVAMAGAPAAQDYIDAKKLIPKILCYEGKPMTRADIKADLHEMGVDLSDETIDDTLTDLMSRPEGDRQKIYQNPDGTYWSKCA
jgi:hypothetical protein